MRLERRSYLVRIATTPPVYIWTGFGYLVTPADYVDDEGATWIGIGSIASLPNLKALINGVAERIEFRLTGVDAAMIALATEDAVNVYHREVRVGSVEFDTDWQLDGGITWEWLGTADRISVESADSDGERKRSIALSAYSADSKRSNPQYAYWTDQSQRIRAADDRFCDHVALISQSVTRKFGPN